MLTIAAALLLAVQSLDETLDLPRSLAEDLSPAAEDSVFTELSDPQARAARPPLFGRPEINFFGGAVMYSSGFESKSTVSGGGGVLLRSPTAWLPTGKFGVWGEFEFTHLSRDLTPPRDNMSGNVYAFAVGADYTFLRTDVWFIMAQAGTVYVAYGDIVGVKDGWGGLAGAVLGFYWVKRDTRFAITINPQFATTGSDWILLVNVGAQFRL